MLTVSPLADRTGLRIDGEADLTSQDKLQKALTALPSDAAEIHFELARLNFIDVAATRALIACTLQPSHPRLILYNPPRSLQLLIHLLWPDSDVLFRFSPAGRCAGTPETSETPFVRLITRDSRPAWQERTEGRSGS